MTYGHFDNGRWVEDGTLSDCILTLTEAEFDAMFALTALGYGVITGKQEKLDEMIRFVSEGIGASFNDPKDFIAAKDGFASKVSRQYDLYMQEIEYKESRSQFMHDIVKWVHKNDK